MAKKKKTEPGDATPTGAPRSGLDESAAAIEAAYAAGNYAAVRRLARQAKALGPQAHAMVDARLEQVKLDPIQLLVGAAALLIVVIIAALTAG